MARVVVLACFLCIGTATALPALSQAGAERGRPPSGWSITPDTHGPRGGSARPVPLVQLDATALLEPPPPLREAPPPQRPMFSDGWTRDGFGGQPRGWR